MSEQADDGGGRGREGFLIFFFERVWRKEMVHVQEWGECCSISRGIMGGRRLCGTGRSESEKQLAMDRKESRISWNWIGWMDSIYFNG